MFYVLACYISARFFLHHRFNFNLDVLTLYSVNSLADWLWIFFTIGVFRNLNIHNWNKFYIHFYIIDFYVTSFGVYMSFLDPLEFTRQGPGLVHLPPRKLAPWGACHAMPAFPVLAGRFLKTRKKNDVPLCLCMFFQWHLLFTRYGC